MRVSYEALGCGDDWLGLRFLIHSRTWQSMGKTAPSETLATEPMYARVAVRGSLISLPFKLAGDSTTRNDNNFLVVSQTSSGGRTNWSQLAESDQLRSMSRFSMSRFDDVPWAKTSPTSGLIVDRSSSAKSVRSSAALARANSK